ncbi:MAG TPA: hypothetical protein VLW26_03900 [Steroidobacteraceae bacterium]|nr:hypothetical protein [Steroidobacteraceae bacterium]
MGILRALVLPFSPAALFFILPCAAILAYLGTTDPIAFMLRILPTLILLAWLFRFAFATLDDVANGEREPPVPSVEMLSPSEARPLLQLCACALVYTLVRYLGGIPGIIVAGVAIVLLPASVALMGVTSSLLEAINPVALVRTVHALGSYYLLIILVIAAYALALIYLAQTALWSYFWYCLAEFAVLSVFSLIGAVLFARRHELEFEPKRSPERTAAAAEEERVKRRSAMLDDVFGPMRVQEFERALIPLKHWLAKSQEATLDLDARAIVSTAVRWNSQRGLDVVAQQVVAHLVRAGHVDTALELLGVALAHDPGCSLSQEHETVMLANRARTTGQRALALQILRNYVNRKPAPLLRSSADALLRDLEALPQPAPSTAR